MDELAKEAFVYKCIMFNYVYVNYLDIDLDIDISFFLFSYFNYRNNIKYRI